MIGAVEQRAKALATYWHASVNHVRKYTGAPYIEHPAAVVELVRSVEHDETMIAAAWLHDAVEDTPCSLANVAAECGADVADLVEQLTDISRPSDGNRAARKALDRAHTAKASPRAKTVKLADLIDNSRSILERDPDFAHVYMREKAELIEVLRAGSPVLWQQAFAIVSAYQDAALQTALSR